MKKLDSKSVFYHKSSASSRSQTSYSFFNGDERSSSIFRPLLKPSLFLFFFSFFIHKLKLTKVTAQLSGIFEENSCLNRNLSVDSKLGVKLSAVPSSQAQNLGQTSLVWSLFRSRSGNIHVWYPPK